MAETVQLTWCLVLICVLPNTEVLHVMLVPNEGEPEPTWAEKQLIKDEFLGRDLWAYECYPPAADLIDEADVYHLFVGAEPPYHL